MTLSFAPAPVRQPRSSAVSRRPVMACSPVMVSRAPAPLSSSEEKSPCACGGGCPSCKAETGIQTKLAISEPGDAFELEANRVADQVMRMAVPTEPLATESGNETSLQRRAADTATAASMPAGVPPIVHDVLRSPGQPLDAATRTFMEPRFGRDFSHVRVHTDGRAAQSARAVNALAYTLGSDIVFDNSQYSPESYTGRALLAHELAHVVQRSVEGLTSAARLQRAVRFETTFMNDTLASGTAATITGNTFNYSDASFAADANVKAIGDTAAELADWDVGILQDNVGGWERYYWLRDNTDRRGRFVEKKFLGGSVRRRDQGSGAATEWDADSEHALLNSVPATVAGSKFEASTTIHTSDAPSGPDTTDGAAVPTMDATDGTLNIRTFYSGGRFQTWISAHNTSTGEWRHLRWINWNYMHSLDFTGTGATLAVGPESWKIGHFGPHTGGPPPLLSGDTANTVYNDPSHWSFRRVNSR